LTKAITVDEVKNVTKAKHTRTEFKIVIVASKSQTESFKVEFKIIVAKARNNYLKQKKKNDLG